MAEGQKQGQLRTVVLVNIEEGSEAAGLFGHMYRGFVNLLKSLDNKSIRLITVASEKELAVKISESQPKVLIFTNDVVAGKKFKQADAVKKFISEGGLVVLACHFSSFVRPMTLNNFFKSLGLPWKSGAYNRTTFEKTTVGQFLLNAVDDMKTEDQINVKAAQLADVSPDQMLYVPAEGAVTNSMVFAPEPADRNSTMAAFGRVGKGAVAFVGDVNAEDKANRLTVALCLVNW